MCKGTGMERLDTDRKGGKMIGYLTDIHNCTHICR